MEIKELEQNDKKLNKNMSWRKYRKIERRNKRIYYKVVHQVKQPPMPLYILELTIGIFFEILRYVRIFLTWAFALSVVIGIGLACYIGVKVYPLYDEYNNSSSEIVSEISKESFAIKESSRIYDSKDNLLSVLREGSDNTYLEYDDIPQDVINAFIAVEDRSFWTNDGVDYRGIVRVGLRAILTKGDELHGASTITQQLVRNNFLTREVSLERKAKEILISRMLTKSFTKREIMEFYVNDICYANDIYGIEGAAKAYFNTNANKLSLSQIAYLCAIPNRPSYYDPYVDPTRALERRDKILEDMLECGYIDKTQYYSAIDETIEITRSSTIFNDYETTYAVDCAIRYMMKKDGFQFQYMFDDEDSYKEYHKLYNETYEEYRHELYTGGYTIYTSLDTDACNALQEILDSNLLFSSEVDEETGIYSLQGAMTVINNETGNVVALVGGRSQESDNQIYSFNRAYQSFRQPGSSIKPIVVYTPALEHGYSASSMLDNIDVKAAHEPGVDVQSLTGSQYDLQTAVWKSLNGTAWKLYNKLTPQVGLFKLELMQYANLHPSDVCDATALGGFTKGVSTVEQASAYAALANHGAWVEPTCITSIIDSTGRDIFNTSEEIQVYEEYAADSMVDILKGVLTNGTAAKLKWSTKTDTEAFAKTGTTNESKDGWLCGATPNYSIAVWVGYDQPKTIDNLSSSKYPGQIWQESMLYMIDGLETAKFTKSDTTSFVTGVEPEETGYNSYLPGRSDDEVLSSGYTVRDYRNDRVIGESVQAIIAKMNQLNMSDINAREKLDQLKAQAESLISTIYSRRYTSEVQSAVDTAYNNKLQ